MGSICGRTADGLHPGSTKLHGHDQKNRANFNWGPVADVDPGGPDFLPVPGPASVACLREYISAGAPSIPTDVINDLEIIWA